MDFTPRIPIMNAAPAEASATLAEALNKAAPEPSVAAKATEIFQRIAPYSPYLTRLMLRYPEMLVRAARGEYQEAITLILNDAQALDEASTQSSWMADARSLKEHMALIVALADLSTQFDLQQVTQSLSIFAKTMVERALHWLIRDAIRRSEWAVKEDSDSLESACGISILGMGKLGAGELNYSSDIDIIVLFDPAKTPYIGARNVQHFMNRIVQQLVHMLQERTEHGYVLRTDIRLRPDPMSTPPAVSVAAALHYYETVGQNWERAAMIKARHLAGEEALTQHVLKSLVPYIWRKNLDFNTIADIHSIMRQMHSASDVPALLNGHNIKTGIGGIRAIEFFVQTQQLVWGGRNPALRSNVTLRALGALKDASLIDANDAATLHHSYLFLRVLEHRLQMVDDAQTHSLPASDEAMQQIAAFMGFPAREEFESHLHSVLSNVQRIYLSAMKDSTPLSAGGNLVFTGVEADEDTLKNLRQMGYQEAERISAIIQGWHRGHRRSTRSRRSRQLLTELAPTLLTTLAKAAHPDTAFFQFDDFLERLPSGVQIFSLIHARPEILEFITHILGSASALGHTLSANPLLLDAMMEPEFFMRLPMLETLKAELQSRIQHSSDFEQTMLLLRVFHHEKRFQAGAHMLKGLASPAAVSGFLSDLAHIVLETTLSAVIAAYRADDAVPESIPMAVLGFGKLGARDLTFDSDLDLVFVYDDRSASEGEPRKHMQRISQRFIHALTFMTREGRLYEIDTRLRPGGASGPIAISYEGFDRYFTHEAWTFEFMALSKARVIATNDAAFADMLSARIHHHICCSRDSAKTIHDMAEMRERVAQEFGTQNPWHIKYVRGGMMDLEFLAQTLVLMHAHAHPAMHQPHVLDVFAQAVRSGVLSSDTAQILADAYHILSVTLSFQRLCIPGGVMTNDKPDGVFVMMARALQLASPATLEDSLASAQANVRVHFDQLVTHHFL